MRRTTIRTLLLVTAGAGVLLVVLRTAANGRDDLRVAPAVDLQRYAGKWYEIARLPNSFQRQCARDVTATYTLRQDGDIDVLNECVKEDGVRQAVTGRAWPAETTSMLKVRFFWPFTGDYWIIALDPDYRWALVGEPGRDNLWVLAREPRMDEEQLASILAIAAGQGFDVGRVMRTPQTQRADIQPTIP